MIINWGATVWSYTIDVSGNYYFSGESTHSPIYNAPIIFKFDSSFSIVWVYRELTLGTKANGAPYIVINSGSIFTCFVD